MLIFVFLSMHGTTFDNERIKLSWLLRLRTWDHRMVGAESSTELLPPPPPIFDKTLFIRMPKYVAQLVERLLPTPEVLSSKPVIGKFIYLTFTVNCIEKTKINEKEVGNGPFLKNNAKTTINNL